MLHAWFREHEALPRLSQSLEQSECQLNHKLLLSTGPGHTLSTDPQDGPWLAVSKCNHCIQEWEWPQESKGGAQISLPELWKESSIRDSGAGVSSAQHCSDSPLCRACKRALPRGTCFNQDYPYHSYSRRKGRTPGFLGGAGHLHSLLHSPEYGPDLQPQ